MRRIYSEETMKELDALAELPKWKWTYADLLKIRDDIRERYDKLKVRSYDSG